MKQLHHAILALSVVGLSQGCLGAVGPVVGWSPTRGGTYGWEVSAGHLFLHAALGQSVRTAESAPRPQEEAATDLSAAQATSGVGRRTTATPWVRVTADETVTYFAAEPWYFGGATLGFTTSSADDDIGFDGGTWAGVAMADTTPGPFASLSVGVRWLHGAAELYLTPKVGWFGG